ncbi:hypothetical protein HXX76_007252 [Chlamydomonas incerta]|uniref:Uncharacterized protein n=1 Tax=Chlamydomonas incerta TaxID=51695 RepID=A0A835T3B6_CHLIN|nr:hypothetical protein HXX76_007252 [Chlamydomonas incerta]|eukprot:KAG2435168.1 hypothetical protein HXX76_007252 [Chlamydomonas incerta]
MHFAAPTGGLLLLPGQHGITYKPALLPEDAGGSTFSSEADENVPGPLDRRSSFQLDDGSVTADCSYSSSSTFWLGSTASSVRSRPTSIFFGTGDVPSTPSALGDAWNAHSPCAARPVGPGHAAPPAFSRRSGEFGAHSAGSYGLVSHASAACTLGPLLEDLPIQFCAARRTLSGQLADGGARRGGGGASGADSSAGAYEDGTGQEDGTDADLDVELDDDDDAHMDAGERKTPRNGGGGGRKAAHPSYAAAVAATQSSPYTPHSVAHRQHHAHGRHGGAGGAGGSSAAIGAGAAGAASSAAALLTAADLSNVAAAAVASAAAAALGAGGKPAPWATTLMNRARAAESRASRLEARLREQRGAMEELQRQLGERDGQLVALRAEVAALRRQQLLLQHSAPLHSPQPAHAHSHSQLQAQLVAANARFRSSSLGGAGAGAGSGGGAAGGSFTSSGACDGGYGGAGVGASAGSYTCGGMATAPPCYNAAVGPLATAAAALTTPTTPEMHHHHHAPYSALHSAPSGDELGQLCDADRLSPPPRLPALSPSPSPPPLQPEQQSGQQAAAADLPADDTSSAAAPLPPAASLPRLDTPQGSELLPCYSSASSTAAGAITASASGSFHLSALASAAVTGPLPPVQEEEPQLACAGVYLGSAGSSARSSAAGSPVVSAAAHAAAAGASPFAALAARALHAEMDLNAPRRRTDADSGAGDSQSLLCVTASLPGGGGALFQSPAELAAARRRTDAAHRALLVSASQAHRLAAALEAERAASEALREELRDWRSCCLDNHKQLAAARRRLAVSASVPQAEASGHGSR